MVIIFLFLTQSGFINSLPTKYISVKNGSDLDRNFYVKGQGPLSEIHVQTIFSTT